MRRRGSYPAYTTPPGETGLSSRRHKAPTRALVMVFEDYDPRYPAVFDRLVREVRTLLGDVRLEHVGSTSVPGLGGQRVIDAVIMHSDPARRCSITTTLLQQGRFSISPLGWLAPTLACTISMAGESYPVLLYVLGEDHPVLRGWLVCRDYWRAHPDEAAYYAKIKRRAIAAGNIYPWTYHQAKSPYRRCCISRVRAR
jgi:dephospho-CoA kinase